MNVKNHAFTIEHHIMRDILTIDLYSIFGLSDI